MVAEYKTDEKTRARAAKRYEEKRTDILAAKKQRTPEQKEAGRQAARRWYQKHRERVLAKLKGKGHHRGRHLHRFFGITEQKYNELSVLQNHVCAACLLPDDKQALCVDHDHKTNKIRGLLCRSCNLALGNAKDSISTLRGLIIYLEKAK